jgi:hypothetical protein
MSANSITLNFQKMPTVTVDGKTQKFTADKTTGEFQEIKQGNVTYSLKKDVTSGKYEMVITGDPKSLEKYNFSVKDGRMTKASFDGKDIDAKYFPGQVDIGAGKSSKKFDPYYQSFSLSGSALASRKDFLKNVFGLEEKDSDEVEDPKNTQTPQNKKDIENGDGVIVEKKLQEPMPVPTRAILKDKAHKLLDKMNKAEEQLPGLEQNSAAKDIRKSLSRLDEGASLNSLKFKNSETEKLFLSSANDYLLGLDADIEALIQPGHPSLGLIKDYPEQFQSALSEMLDYVEIAGNSQDNSKILSSLPEDKKEKVLKKFDYLVNQKVISVVDSDSTSSASDPSQKSAQLLESLGLQRQVVPGDGNCFYFASRANDQPDLAGSSISNSPRSANEQRHQMLEILQIMTPKQAQTKFPGKEFFMTWEALQSGLLSEDQLSSAEKNSSRPSIDFSSWGNSSHLKLNAIRTDKPQVVIDAGSQKVHVYYPKGKTKSVDASAENVKSDLHDFIAERGAHIYEALPNHWNAVQVAKE